MNCKRWKDQKEVDLLVKLAKEGKNRQQISHGLAMHGYERSADHCYDKLWNLGIKVTPVRKPAKTHQQTKTWRHSDLYSEMVAVNQLARMPWSGDAIALAMGDKFIAQTIPAFAGDAWN